MTTIEIMARHQQAVIWLVTGFDQYGDPELGSPSEIDVRWIDGQRTAFDDKGNEIVADCSIILGEDVPLGTIIRLGSLSELPDDPDNLMEIIFVNKTPDIKGRKFQRTAMARRYGKQIP